MKADLKLQPKRPESPVVLNNNPTKWLTIQKVKINTTNAMLAAQPVQPIKTLGKATVLASNSNKHRVRLLVVKLWGLMSLVNLILRLQLMRRVTMAAKWFTPAQLLRKAQ